MTDAGVKIVYGWTAKYSPRVFEYPPPPESTKYWHLGPVDLYEELRRGQ